MEKLHLRLALALLLLILPFSGAMPYLAPESLSTVAELGQLSAEDQRLYSLNQLRQHLHTTLPVPVPVPVPVAVAVANPVRDVGFDTTPLTQTVRTRESDPRRPRVSSQDSMQPVTIAPPNTPDHPLDAID